MEQSVVDRVETKLAKAIRDAFKEWRSNVKLPLAPDERTVHLMAKAATAVYEAVVDTIDTQQGQPRD